MSTAFIIFLGSISIFSICISVFYIEDVRNGKRIVLPKIRSWFDKQITIGLQKLMKIDTYLGRGIARLMLHYAAHGILKRSLIWLHITEKKIEYLLKRNRQVAKEIKKGNRITHLSALKQYKEDTALTDAQVRKMKSHD